MKIHDVLSGFLKINHALGVHYASCLGYFELSFNAFSSSKQRGFINQQVVHVLESEDFSLSQFNLLHCLHYVKFISDIIYHISL